MNSICRQIFPICTSVYRMTLNFFQEFFSVRNDASLFIFGSHSKKRPHNLVLGMFFHSLEHLTLIPWNTSCYKSKIMSYVL